MAAVVVKHAHGVLPLLHEVVHRVWVVGIFCAQVAIAVGVACLGLKEARNRLVVVVEPAVAVAPVVLEVLLHHLHLFLHRLLGIFLHARVERGVDFQSVGI